MINCVKCGAVCLSYVSENVKYSYCTNQACQYQQRINLDEHNAVLDIIRQIEHANPTGDGDQVGGWQSGSSNI